MVNVPEIGVVEVAATLTNGAGVPISPVDAMTGVFPHVLFVGIGSVVIVQLTVVGTGVAVASASMCIRLLESSIVWPSPSVSCAFAACNCHPSVVPRVSVTVVVNEKEFQPPGVAKPVVIVTIASLTNTSPATLGPTCVVQLVVVVPPQVVALATIAALLCPPKAPAIIATSMKIVATFRILRLFKILMEKPFLYWYLSSQHHCIKDVASQVL
jgi:hypothetical protein